MSTGQPKEYFNPNASIQLGLAVRSSTDMCKGCRKCCQSMVKTIAANRGLTAGCISIPMFAMALFLIYLETSLSPYIHTLPALQIPQYQQYKLVIFSPMYILASITFGFGILGLIAIKCEFQNLLRFSAFVYRGIAHWVLLSIFLLVCPIAGYLPLYIIMQITGWSLLPAFLWLFTAAVMTAHCDLISAAIESRSTTQQQINDAMV